MTEITLKQHEAARRRRGLRLEYLPAFIALLSEVLGREIRSARDVSDGTKHTLRDWIEVFYPILADRLARSALPVVREYGGKVAETALAEIDALDMRFDVEPLSLDYAQKLAARWTNDSIGQLRAMLRDTPDDEFGDAFDEKMTSWQDGQRAATSAAAEATQAGGAFTKVPFIAAGIERMIWVAGTDACPLCQRLNGRVVEITQPFLAEGDTVDPEDGETTPLVTKQVIGHPPLHGMGGRGGVCDCVVVAA